MSGFDTRRLPGYLRVCLGPDDSLVVAQVDLE